MFATQLISILSHSTCCFLKKLLGLLVICFTKEGFPPELNSLSIAQLLCIFHVFSPSLTSSSFLQPWGLNSGPQSTTTDLYFYLEAGSHKLPRWPRMYLVGHVGLEVLSSCLSPLRSCYLLSLSLSSWFMEIKRATTCVPSSPHRTPWTCLCLYPMLLFVSFSERGSLLQWSVFTVSLTRFQIT